MKPAPNTHHLRDNLVWQRERFDSQVASLHRTLTRLSREITEAVDRVDYGDDGTALGREHTHSDAAAYVVGAASQAFANLDLRGLVSDAAMVTTTEQSIRLLAEYRDLLPPNAAVAAETTELAQYNRAVEERTSRETARRKRVDESCEASVSQGGRGVGHRRCSNRATTTAIDQHGNERQVCRKHAIERRSGFMKTRT